MSDWEQIKAYLRLRSTWNGHTGLPWLTLEHLQITLIAVGIAAAVSLPLAVGMGHRHRGGVFVTMIANATRSIPTYGLLVLMSGFAIVGIGDKAAIIGLAVFALAPLLTNTYAGMVGVDPDAIEAARGMGMSGRQMLLRVEVPLALPLIAAGLRTAIVQTVATATLAAFVGGTGLGVPIDIGIGLAAAGTGELISGAVAVALLTLVVELVLGAVEGAITPGAPRRRRLLRLRPAAPLTPPVAAEGM